MKIVFGSLLIALAIAPSMRAQTESFDIATYVRPPGWSSAVSNGILVLQARQSHLGRVEFCQIYLFPSTSSSQSPAASFQNEWNARIVQSMGLSVRPAPQTETTPRRVDRPDWFRRWAHPGSAGADHVDHRNRIREVDDLPRHRVAGVLPEGTQ
jgi:hypothetical protein